MSTTILRKVKNLGKLPMVKKRSGKASEKFDMADLITQVEAAQIRSVSRAAITDLVKRGRLRTVELFGKKLVLRSEVENFEPERKGWPKGKSRKDEH